MNLSCVLKDIVRERKQKDQTTFKHTEQRVISSCSFGYALLRNDKSGKDM